jgi:uncharacterized protein (TIGR03083 family)
MQERKMDAPADLVTVFHAEAERLSQYLDTLPPDAWTQPSACEGWAVRDVIGHLTFLAEFYADVIARGVQGDTALLPDRPPGDGPAHAAFHAYLAERAIACRERAMDYSFPMDRMVGMDFLLQVGAVIDLSRLEVHQASY